MNPSSRRAPIPPILALVFGIAAVSTASIFIRFAQASAPSMVIAALRLAFASLVLLPNAALRRRGEIRALSQSDLGLLVLSGLFLAFHFGTWISSLEYTTVASSVVLVQTTPLWVALLSVVLLHERIGQGVTVGLVVALLGGALVGIGNACQVSGGTLVCEPLGQILQGRAMLGNLLALAGAIFVSGYLIIGRRMRSSLSLLSYTSIVYGSAAVFLLLGVALFRQPLSGYPPMVYAWCLALALVPQLLGHSTFNWALAYLPTTFVSVALLGEPVGSTILAYIILHQVPSLFELVGGALILLGIFLASRSS